MRRLQRTRPYTRLLVPPPADRGSCPAALFAFACHRAHRAGSPRRHLRADNVSPTIHMAAPSPNPKQDHRNKRRASGRTIPEPILSITEHMLTELGSTERNNSLARRAFTFISCRQRTSSIQSQRRATTRARTQTHASDIDCPSRSNRLGSSPAQCICLRRPTPAHKVVVWSTARFITQSCAPLIQLVDALYGHLRVVSARGALAPLGCRRNTHPKT